MHTFDEAERTDEVEARPRLADGVELLGAFEGSGYKQPHFLVRRVDGELIHVSRLVYLVASAMEGERDLDHIARRVTDEFGRAVSAENVRYLVDEKLAPLGLVSDGRDAVLGRARPILALSLRKGLVPEHLHRRVSSAAQVFFVPAIIAGVLVAFVAVDAWLVLNGPRPVLDAFATIVQSPKLLLVLTALTLASAVFHEIGHAAAARYGGATPGAMGVGVYLVWPVFFTDVTDSYRLDRRGRLRTDLGGVYFNVIFVSVTAIAYGLTGFTPLLAYVVVGQLETMRQFLPFVRLDGYYVVSDLAGVPNLFAYLGPVMTRVVRRRDVDAVRIADAKLAELNPRSRRIITTWVYVTAPILALNIVAFLFVAPHVAGPMLLSVRDSFGAFRDSISATDVAGTINGVIDLALLLLPVVGLTYIGTRLAVQAAARYARTYRRYPRSTATVTGAVAVAVAIQVALWWPGAVEESIDRAERRSRPEVAAAVEVSPALPAAGEVAPGTTVTLDAARRAGETAGAPSTGDDPSTTGTSSGSAGSTPASPTPQPPTSPPSTRTPTTSGRPPITPPPVTVAGTVTAPPVALPAVTAGPVTLGPITLPPVTVALPPVTVALPPVTAALPPVTVALPPVTVTLPPVQVSLPPVTVALPPITVPPITLPIDLGLL